MGGLDATSVRIKIGKNENDGNLYRCTMSMDGEEKIAECDVEFPFGRVELLQPI